jgi:hypothetical protein
MPTVTRQAGLDQAGQPIGAAAGGEDVAPRGAQDMNDGAYLSEVVAAESNWQARLRHVRQATEAPVDPRVMAAVT